MPACVTVVATGLVDPSPSPRYELGINQSTVSRARNSGVTFVTPERIGQDGKSYSIRQRVTDDPDISPKVAHNHVHGADRGARGDLEFARPMIPNAGSPRNPKMMSGLPRIPDSHRKSRHVRKVP